MERAAAKPLEGYLHGSLTRNIVGAAIEVHRALGPGLLESAYEACLVRELGERRLSFRRQIAVPLHYKGLEVDCGYRADLVVEDCVLVELKAVERLLSIHDAQLLTYLKLCGLRVGLLMNFNAVPLARGIRRLVR